MTLGFNRKRLMQTIAAPARPEGCRVSDAIARAMEARLDGRFSTYPPLEITNDSYDVLLILLVSLAKRIPVVSIG